MDERQFRNAMGNFATGITVVTTEFEKEIHGMTVNSFTSVSLDPKLVLVSIANTSKMLHYIRQSRAFSVSFLAADQQEISKQFAGQKKDGTPYEFGRFNSQPIIDNALANITCDLYKEYVVGDHTLFIGEVTDFRLNEGEPILYYQGKYRELNNERQ